MSIYKKLIFVVDDDPMMCEMLADHLMKNPHNSVKTFATGEECLKCLDENPSAVILDINLIGNNENAASGMDIRKMIKQMALENFFILMEMSMKANGVMIKLMELENTFTQTEQFMKVNGYLMCSKDKE